MEDPKESTMDTSIALMRQDISYMKSDVRDIKTQMGSAFVTKDEFTPYKQKVDAVFRALVWVVGVLVLGAFAAFFKLVFK